MTPEQYRRLKELFHTAAALDAAKQTAFIAEACGDDAELAAELRSLLEHAHGQPLLTQTQSQLTHGGASTRRGSTRGSRINIAQTWAWFTAPRFRWVRAWVPWLMAVAASVGVAWWIHERVHFTIAEARQHELQAILRADVSAIEHLIDRERIAVANLTDDLELRLELAKLVALPGSQSSAAQRTATVPTISTELLARIRQRTREDAEFAAWDRKMLTLVDSAHESASTDDATGRPVSERGAQLLNRVFSGQTVVLRPDFNFMLRKQPDPRPETIGMGLLAPVYDPEDSQQIIAAIMIRSRSLLQAFDAILAHGHFETTGEAYVFNRQGMLLSESRFVDQLTRAGLLTPATSETLRSARLVLEVKDPGGDMTRGFVPALPRTAQPLTEMVRMAATGQAGSSVTGYRDYRGVLVVGAWNWLADPDIGIAIEIDYDEAFRPMIYVRRGIVAVGLVIFGWTLFLATSTIRTLRARALIRQVGPYHFLRRIGKGGMGEVFLAEHALLKRPTAVKLIRPDKTNHQTLAWFEREVHAISQLTHPNTIQIYDYGHTDDGTFYYAMEYLDGLDVEALVRIEGQVSPERTVYLLRQACLSLREAHQRQLVHRDIKPHNIMLCARGGMYDVVKLLDFGLVKDIADDSERNSSLTQVVAGTPAYMAPERLSDPLRVDGRADIFALGAVTYRMLTGADPFDGRIMLYDAQQPPDDSMRPSRRSRYVVPTALDDLVRACLSPQPDDRPANVQVMLDQLDALTFDEPWTTSAAESWWISRGFASGTATDLRTE